MAANEYIDVGPNGMVPEEAATNGGVANAGDIVALNPSGQIDLSMLPPSGQPLAGGTSTVVANQLILGICLPVSGNLASNFNGSQASCQTAATDASTFTVYHVAVGTNTQTEIGTIVFGAGAYTATFETISGANLNFDIGDTLLVLCPSTADATLANVTCSIVGVN